MPTKINEDSLNASRDEEIKGLNENIADLELYLRDLNEFLPIPVCVISPIGIIIDANRSFLVMSEYHSTDLIGKPIETLFTEPGRIRNTLKLLERDIKKTLSLEFVFLSRENKSIPVNFSINVKRDQDNELTGYTIALIDISERKRFQDELERQVEEKTRELQQKIEELEKINKLTLRRELKMIELKQQIKELKQSN